MDGLHKTKMKCMRGEALFWGATCGPYWPGLSSCPFTMTSSGVKRRPGSERASARAMSALRNSEIVICDISKPSENQACQWDYTK